MRPYQEEYISNLKEGIALSWSGQEIPSFQEYLTQAEAQKQRAEERAKRNMRLLREELFPVLDHIYDADEEDIRGLEEFAGQLLSGREELDVGLFCQVHKALLSLARRRKDRNSMIRELYWLGMAYYNLCNKMVGLANSDSQTYTSRMRLCFTEAAADRKSVV